MSVDVEDDDYFDDENVDWKSIMQGQKSVGDIMVMLVWKFGEIGQKKLVELFDIGEVCVFCIRYFNGMVDVFCGWLSLLGKIVMFKEVMICSVKIIGVGCFFFVEEDIFDVVSVFGVIVVLVSVMVVVGVIIMLIFMVKFDNVLDKMLQVVIVDLLIVIVMLKDNVVMVKGVKVGSVNIVGISSDGSFVVVVVVIVMVL